MLLHFKKKGAYYGFKIQKGIQFTTSVHNELVTAVEVHDNPANNHYKSVLVERGDGSQRWTSVKVR